jgi:hypothetical protein
MFLATTKPPQIHHVSTSEAPRFCTQEPAKTAQFSQTPPKNTTKEKISHAARNN